MPKHNSVIEDATPSAWYKGKKIGTHGHGPLFLRPDQEHHDREAGPAVCDDGVAEEMRRQRILGIDKDTWHRYKNTRTYFYEVVSPGFRYHMPNFCAAVGLEQLKKLPDFIARRRELAKRYDAAFAGLSQVRPLKVDYATVAPHIYIVRLPAERRDAFMEALKARGVGTGLHYIANHIQPYFKKYARGPLPRAERLWQEIVTLPLHCAMTDEDVQTVIWAVTEFCKSRAAA